MWIQVRRSRGIGISLQSLKPKAYALCPKPYALSPKHLACGCHFVPKPYTLNPTTQTLSPKP
jgi:hypothetical protein